ncbi:MAG: hypothetical protein ACI8RD_009099 [Bacillariaceae sp.]|jgi:hypothetical protein
MLLDSSAIQINNSIQIRQSTMMYSTCLFVCLLLYVVRPPMVTHHEDESFVHSTMICDVIDAVDNALYST